MDYKYIKQLLQRYWQGATSLEEEQILRSFFSQDDIPEDLAVYKALFVYENIAAQECPLGEQFDERLLAMTEGAKEVKAVKITMRRRLIPLFRAAAIVAIVLSLSNAAQMSMQNNDYEDVQTQDGLNAGREVALGDTAKIDTLHQGAYNAIDVEMPVLMK